jgi:hypothetical protein
MPLVDPAAARATVKTGRAGAQHSPDDLLFLRFDHHHL